MDEEDRKILFDFYTDLDNKLMEPYEKIIWKIMPKLDKLVVEKLGWRRKDPEDQRERFDAFMEFVKQVYLRPSLLKSDDSDWSSGSNSMDTHFDGADFGSEDEFDWQ